MFDKDTTIRDLARDKRAADFFLQNDIDPHSDETIEIEADKHDLDPDSLLFTLQRLVKRGEKE